MLSRVSIGPLRKSLMMMTTEYACKAVMLKEGHILSEPVPVSRCA